MAKYFDPFSFHQLKPVFLNLNGLSSWSQEESLLQDMQKKKVLFLFISSVLAHIFCL